MAKTLCSVVALLACSFRYAMFQDNTCGTITPTDVNLGENCSMLDRCPDNSDCILQGCQRTCACTLGFIASWNQTACSQVRVLGQSCSSGDTVCRGAFTECKNSTCQCLDSYEKSITEKCRPRGFSDVLEFALLGELCDDIKNCFMGLVCERGECTCEHGKIRVNEEEQLRDPFNPLECRDVGISQVSSKKSLFDYCIDSDECQQNSTCALHVCDRRVCVCDVGFLPSEKYTTCLKSAGYGEPCNDTVMCSGRGVQCLNNHVCGCEEPYQILINKKCTIGSGLSQYQFSSYGDYCNDTILCQNSFEQSCIQSACICDKDKGYRNKIPVETGIHAYATMDCIPITYNIDIIPASCATLSAVRINESCNSLDTVCPHLTKCVDRDGEEKRCHCILNFVPFQNLTGCHIPVLKIFEKCDDNIMCPIDSSCRLRGCDGLMCICVVGYVPDENYEECLEAVSYGEQCNSTHGCYGLNVLCISGVCDCEGSFRLASNGRCKTDLGPTGMQYALLGEHCDAEVSCMNNFEQTCDDGVCQCDALRGFRKTTAMETHVAPFMTLECRPFNFSIDRVGLYCDNAKLVQVGEDCRDVFELCPEHATCISEACGLHRCRCDSGFVPADDNSACWSVSFPGESCDKTRTQCHGVFSPCDTNKICSCSRPYEISNDGIWCKIKSSSSVGFSLLDEYCDDRRIFCVNTFEQWCKDKVCACGSGLRPATMEEILSDVNSIAQCRPTISDSIAPNCTSPILSNVGFNTPATEEYSEWIHPLVVGVSVTIILVFVILAVLFSVRRQRRRRANAKRMQLISRKEDDDEFDVTDTQTSGPSTSILTWLPESIRYPQSNSETKGSGDSVL